MKYLYFLFILPSVFGITFFAEASNCCKCTLPNKFDACITDPPDVNCAEIFDVNHIKLPDSMSGTTCAHVNDAQCKLISEPSGICQEKKTYIDLKANIDSIAAKVVATTSTSDTSSSSTDLKKGDFTFTLQPPKLNIDIPLLKFAAGGNQTGGEAEIPWFAQYIAALFNYLLGISLITAAIMIVYGGFLYTLSATVSSITKGKEIIQDAIIGTIILLSIVLILKIIPGIALKPIRIKYVEQLFLNVSRSVSSGTAGPIAVNGGDPATAAGAIKAAKDFKVDPCILASICQHESGMKARTWNGDFAGTPIEKAGYFGACGTGLEYMPTLSPQIKKFAPNMPSEKIAIRDWMMTPEGSGYAGAVMLKGNIDGSPNKNEVFALAGYAGGLGAAKNAADKHNCKPQPLTMKKAVDMSLDDVLTKSCIFSPVATGGANSERCPADKGVCDGTIPLLANKKAELWGTCKTGGAKCLAMDNTGMIKFVMGVYKNMIAKYQCDK